MVVSFIGSIPLGSINLSTLQITLEKDTKAGLQFALGATLVELIYSFLAIKFSAYLLQNKDIGLYIQLVAIPAFILLSLYSFKKKNAAIKTNKVKNKSAFFKGIMLGFINPLQIPFWVAYGTYMLSNGWIKNEHFLLNCFILGIITGTYLLLSLVVFLSKLLDTHLNLSRFNINRILGYVFMALAVYQTIKLAL